MSYNRLLILFISLVSALIIHLTVSVNVLSHMVLFINPIISGIVLVIFFMCQLFGIYMLLHYLIRGFKEKTWELLPYEVKMLQVVYVVITCLALFGRGLFTTRTSFNFDVTTIFEMGTTLAPIAFAFNLLWFVPLGLFTNWSFIKTFSLFIILEAIQVILQCGIFDINDLILYTIGFLIGRGLQLLFKL